MAAGFLLDGDGGPRPAHFRGAGRDLSIGAYRELVWKGRGTGRGAERGGAKRLQYCSCEYRVHNSAEMRFANNAGTILHT